MTKEEQKEYNRQYREKNREQILLKKQEYKNARRKELAEKQKEYYKNNKEKSSATKKQWYLKNKERLIEKQNEKNRIKYQNDVLYRMSKNLKSVINNSLTKCGYTRKTKTELILGCTYQEFKLYLESKFEFWMNWENKGNPKDGILELNKTWDIDHIIPLSSATCEEDIIRLNHYTNLQPLCSYTNRYIKKDNIE